MSVHIAEILGRHGLGPEWTLTDYPAHSLVALTVGTARSEDQEVVETPTETDPSHGEIRGDKPRAVARRLAGASRWVVLRV